MLVILIAALPQHVPEEDVPLAGVHQIFHSGIEQASPRH
jgi:hypothetical protein